MYILDATTRSLRLSISGSIATQLPFVTSYVLIGQNTFIPGTNHGSSSNTNFVTFLQSPTAGTQSQLKFFSLYNPNATSCSALIHYIDNTTTRSIYKTIIYPYETLFYTDGAGWYNNSKNDISQHINHNVLYNLQGGQGDNRYHLGVSSDGSRYSSSLPFLQISSDEVKSDSSSFVSGFTGQGYSITKSNNKYTAQFDNLWVRGSMNIKQFTIDQIRATNGSLWVSDAAHAVNVSYDLSSNRVLLSFDTASTLPFIQGDIIRSKRYLVHGTTQIVSWDYIGTVSSVSQFDGVPAVYVSYEPSLIQPATTMFNLTSKILTPMRDSGSDWVRMGHDNDPARQGNIYLTANDDGAPYIDIINGVSRSSQVNNLGSLIKVRLGNLNGLSLGGFTNMSGYGLYSDNAFLKGTISAKAGDIAGWNLNDTSIYKKVSGNTFSITNSVDGAGLFVYSGANPVWNNSSTKVYIGSDGKFSLGDQLTFNNGQLTISGIEVDVAELGGWSVGDTTIHANGITLSSENPSIQIGATGYGTDGIWLGKGNKWSASMWNGTTARGLKWNGDSLLISASNFSLDTNGKISANKGIIGGWTIDGSGLYATDQDWYVGIGTKQISFLNTYGDYLLMGTNSHFFNGYGIGYYIPHGNSLNPYFKVDRDGAFLSGTITASAGTIGGWTINSNGLSSSNVTISSQTNYQGIRITTASTSLNITNSLNYIYLGKWNSDNVLHLKGDSSNYFKWDANGLNIKSPKLTLSPNALNVSGSITTSAGLFGGWTINSGGISSTHSYGTVSITKSGTSILALTDTYGNFTYSAANSHMFTNKTNLYQKTSASFIPTITKYESDLNITTANPNKGFGIQFTDWCPDPGTPLIAFAIDDIDEGVQYTLQSKVINPKNTASLHHVSSLFFAITSDLNPSSPVIFSNTENPLWNRYSSENEILKQYKFSRPKGVGSPKVYLWLMGTMRPNSGVPVNKKPTFTFSGFRIDSSKQYTQLSQKGLLVFNTPQNYIQLVSENGSTTNSSQASLGLVNMETLYVNGISVNSALTTPRPVALGGTGTSSFAHRQFLWYDTQSGMITASGFSSSSGGGSGMADYNGVVLAGANVISKINIASGVMTTASRALTAGDISAVATSRKVEGTGLLGGGGALSANRTITHNIANGAYHLPANGSAGQLIMRSGTAGSGSWTSNIQTTGTASFASITASAGFTSSTGNIAVGGSITSAQVVKAMDFEASKEYRFSGVGSIIVDQVHGTALDLQDFSSLKIGGQNDYVTSTNTFLQGIGNTARGDVIHIQGARNVASGNVIHIEGYENRAEVNYGHTQGSNAIGHIVGSKTFANGSMDNQFPESTTQVSTIVLYAYNLIYDTLPLINRFYYQGVIDFNRAGLVIDHLHISFFLNVMITYHQSDRAYAYQQTFTYNINGNYSQINTGEPYGDVSATAQIPPRDLGDLELVQDQTGMIHFLYTPTRNFEINSVIVKVEMIEHIAYIIK